MRPKLLSPVGIDCTAAAVVARRLETASASLLRVRAAALKPGCVRDVGRCSPCPWLRSSLYQVVVVSGKKMRGKNIKTVSHSSGGDADAEASVDFG
jgi:hypothetical protein